MNALGKFPPLEEAVTPAPADLAITVRDRRFARASKPRWWLNGDPIATAWLHSLSATFPRGEAFFIESVKAFREGTPPRLAEEIRAFVAQEVNHSREHIAFNRAAVEAGYDLSAIDAHVAEWIDIARSRPVIFNLAATIALEHFTAMMAHEFLLRPEYFEGAHAESAALWRWHAIEEIEHKGVAYDTFLHATKGWSRWKRWKLKSLVMLAVTNDFVRNRIRDTLQLLAQDGITGPRVRWRLLAYLFWSPGVLRRILPAWLGYFLPGFHPWNHDDRALIANAAADLAEPKAAA
ncbi:metal-dependent hydrolase [Novosphingobium sp. JCM 18896]|uniref:metal-dependent hydrolase n=1 Tax=Novosphingobium sp. JCM 18896 TaxID=2989731 RepID=UPI0022227930|nr:metal-dependent hydrolase [Novosphingobium sp. JCM 18896]MCW1430440.1 metal-dependent hydrolase [Novosphingobium sp. JCM 18896]